MWLLEKLKEVFKTRERKQAETLEDLVRLTLIKKIEMERYKKLQEEKKQALEKNNKEKFKKIDEKENEFLKEMSKTSEKLRNTRKKMNDLTYEL